MYITRSDYCKCSALQSVRFGIISSSIIPNRNKISKSLQDKPAQSLCSGVIARAIFKKHEIRSCGGIILFTLCLHTYGRSITPSAGIALLCNNLLTSAVISCWTLATNSSVVNPFTRVSKPYSPNPNSTVSFIYFSGPSK